MPAIFTFTVPKFVNNYNTDIYNK